ncbi:glycoside hydrolase family 127 protein [Planctomycetota bacterium]
MTDGFFAQRFELAASRMLPTLERSMLGDCTANLNRLKEAAGLVEAGQHGSPWGDGDNYKWIEAMAHVYNLNKDPVLHRKMDEWIEIIGKAMEPDGYISTNIMHDQSKRFVRSNAHEMYNMGHLLTAACIHYRATGKKNFLNIAKKNADFLCRQWKAEPARMARFPWNPSAFMGVAEMYRIIRDKNYLELLETMINNRGSRPNPDRNHAYGGTDQTQDRVPLHQEHLAVGHAVTGNYYYCGAADLYAEIGDPEILAALERIWKDIHERKTDITLGVAMDRHSESLSPRGDEVHENFANEPYLQPNLYSETCANIGAGMFNYRMFMLTGDAKYADWTERMLYNTLNSGVDLQGQRWFYCNPVTWDGTEGMMIKQTNGRNPNRLVPGHQSGVRWEYMNCYCCPPSVTRTTAKIHNWFYNISDDGALWVNFYSGNKLSTTLADGSPITLTQVTDYPWDGRIQVTLDDVLTHKPVSLYFRIPGWTENPTVTVNGTRTDVPPVPGSYLEIYRYWNPGDEIVLEFPMPVRLMEAKPKIVKLRGKVAVMRGPVVYCMELPVKEGGKEIFENGVYLPQSIELTPEHRSNFLGGVTVLKGKALTAGGKKLYARTRDSGQGLPEQAAWEDGQLYRPMSPTKRKIPNEGTIQLELIPYYAWANRGLAYMDVWIPLAR